MPNKRESKGVEDLTRPLLGEHRAQDDVAITIRPKPAKGSAVGGWDEQKHVTNAVDLSSLPLIYILSYLPADQVLDKQFVVNKRWFYAVMLMRNALKKQVPAPLFYDRFNFLYWQYCLPSDQSKKLLQTSRDEIEVQREQWSKGMTPVNLGRWNASEACGVIGAILVSVSFILWVMIEVSESIKQKRFANDQTTMAYAAIFGFFALCTCGARLRASYYESQSFPEVRKQLSSDVQRHLVTLFDNVVSKDKRIWYRWYQTGRAPLLISVREGRLYQKVQSTDVGIPAQVEPVLAMINDELRPPAIVAP